MSKPLRDKEIFRLAAVYGDGIHLTVAHKREWSYGFKPDNKTVPYRVIWSHRM